MIIITKKKKAIVKFEVDGERETFIKLMEGYKKANDEGVAMTVVIGRDNERQVK